MYKIVCMKSLFVLLFVAVLFGCYKEEGYICTGTDCYGEFEVWVPTWQADEYCDQLIIEDCKCEKL